MRIAFRDAKEADYAAIEAMAALHDYALPPLGDRSVVVKFVAEDLSGKPVMAALAKLTAEAVVISDPRLGTPQERWETIRYGNEILRLQSFAAGFNELHSWLTEDNSGRFGRRLETLGWRRSRGQCYVLDLEG